MRTLCLILLSICALGSTTPISFADSLEGGTLEHNVGPLELTTSLSAAENDVEDHIAEFFSKLNDEQRNLIAQVIQDALDGFRDVVINGNEDLPPLDPLVIDSLGPFVYTALGVRASADIRNLRAEGLKWYVVDHVTFNVLRLTLGVQVTIPWITITGGYNARATVVLINHNAGGNFRIFANRIVVGVDARLGTNLLGGHLVLRELDVRIEIHDTQISISGMVGSSLINSFINSLVQSITQEVIQNEMGNVSRLISEQAFDIVNDILRDYTLADILG